MQTQPLNDADFEILDDILLKHGDDHSVLNTCELDGFFTALVSGPAQVDIADWFPAIWGGQNPNWENTGEAKQFIELSVRHMNTLARQLADGSEVFAPASNKPSITASPLPLPKNGALATCAVSPWPTGHPCLWFRRSCCRAFPNVPNRTTSSCRRIWTWPPISNRLLKSSRQHVACMTSG